MRKELKSKEYRHAYAKAFMQNSVAFQIHALRDKERLSQGELGARCGMRQNAISRLEDPDYGKLSFETLAKLAEAFDVVPVAGFISFSELERRRKEIADGQLIPLSFEEDSAEAALIPAVTANTGIPTEIEISIARIWFSFVDLSEDAPIRAISGGRLPTPALPNEFVTTGTELYEKEISRQEITAAAC